ncbi:MAG TPA: hypothetical protein VN829_14665 [Dongiaceae bacterium]|nr:hypothetical protein [Dongiaceae bacterium]
MNTTFSETKLAGLIMLLIIGASAALAAPVGTAFTYQGWLAEGADPANGSYDFRFALYDGAASTSQVGPTLTNAAVGVNHGLFTAALDFGAGVFTGEAGWLEIAVRTNGGGDFIALAPRQPVTATPYALDAASVDSVLASHITGTLADAQLSTNIARLSGNQVLSGSNIFKGAVLLTNAANALRGQFSGDGSQLTNLNAANLAGTLSDARLSANVALLGANQVFSGSNTFKGTVLLTNASNSLAGSFLGDGTGLTNLNAGLLDGLQATQFWNLAGNSGATPGNFLGTTDTRALELRVNSDRGLRLEPVAASPNLIGGSRSNAVSAGVAGAAIGGGGTTGSPNLIAGDFGTVSGGIQNTILGGALGSAVSGGGTNTIEAGSQYCVIGGGGGNRIQAAGQYCRIGGGSGNVVQTNASFSTIDGGSANVIQQGATNAVVGGGRLNTIGAASSLAVIAGGSGNTIQGGASVAAIGGGSSNRVAATAAFATIPGGAGASADKYGQLAYASGSFAVAGDAQTAVYVLRGTSSGGNPGELFLDGVSRRMTVPTNTAWMFRILMVGHGAAGEAAGLELTGLIANKGGNPPLTLYGGLVQSLYGDPDSWNATLTADQTDQALVLKGILANPTHTMHWVATVHTAEIGW